MSPQSKSPIALIYERLYVIAVITAVAVVAAFVATGMMSETYRSQARCYLPTQSDTLSLSTESGNLPTAPKLPTANTETQTALLGVLNSAELRTAVAAQINERNSEWLEKNVKFDLDAFNFIVISAYDPEPRIAREVAEAYLREFSRKLDTTTKQRVAESASTLVAAIVRSQEFVATLESTRQDFLTTNGSIDFSTEIAEYHTRVTRFRDSVEKNISARASLIKQREEVTRNFEMRPEFTQSGYTEIQNPRLNQLRGEIATTELEIASLRLGVTDKNPKAIALREKLAVLKDQFAYEAATVEGSRSFSSDSMRKSYETRLAEFKVSEAELHVQSSHYTNLLVESQDRLRELNHLRAESEIIGSELRNVRDTLRQQRDRHAELELYMLRDASFLMTAEAPVEATKPYFPILWLNLLVATLLGIVFSILAIITSEQFARYREAAPW